MSKQSLYFHQSMEEFHKVLENLHVSPMSIEVIDVSEEPEKAEEYRVDALPTLCIGKMRFVGIPHVGAVLSMLSGEEKTL